MINPRLGIDASEHRQWGPVGIFFILVVAAAIIYAGRQAYPIYLAAVILVITSAGFSRLTTQVDPSGVSWSLTFGMPRGHVAFADLDRAEPATTNILEGWGVHWTIWHGWLWKMWGFRAVQLFLRSGRRITLGTNDPHGLLAAIQRFHRHHRA